MEGAYFYGEHLRWNLGWENPNPAGAFVAMGIPWLWAIASGAVRQGGWKCRLLGVVAFLGEAALWFLLCKTYSRGALVAAFVAAAVYCGLSTYRDGWRRTVGMTGVRGVMVIALLLGSGFFSRIDPGYVVEDASAMNRLTLWKGGLKMIAVSPWRGWGVGESGDDFMHWFQPLEADEAYAGMVNSYLHVGVERGLPVLGGVLALVGAVLAVVGFAVKDRGSCDCCLRGGSAGVKDFVQGAGCSVVVFLVANVFSTLWIFGNLWWSPMVATVVILAGSGWLLRGRIARFSGLSCGIGVGLGTVACFALWAAGERITAETRIELRKNGSVVCRSAAGDGGSKVVLLPDASVLGETWGKEVRRLATSDPSLTVLVPGDRNVEGVSDGTVPGWVIACGSRVDEGLAYLKDSPGIRLTLVHPLGKPSVAGGFENDVRVIVPALDTSGSGRRWSALARRHGWENWRSDGVGQDIRLRWPGVLGGSIAP